MDELILAALRGTITPDDARQLDAWRHASPEHEQTYREVERVWRLSGTLVVRPRPSAADLIGNARPPIRPMPHPRTWRTVLPIAAALTVLIAGGIVFARTIRVGPSPHHLVASAGANPETATLDDGSVVRLAPGSSITYRETPARRIVDLDGAAFFAVRADPGRPLTVTTPVGTATVLGTRFEIRHAGDSLTVLVREGIVAVETDHDTTLVRAGEAAVAVGGILARPSLDATRNLAVWSRGVLVFRDTPLHHVVDEVEHFFGRTIALDSSRADIPITAWFEDEPFTEVVRTICVIAAVDCDISSPPTTHIR